jgi:hypothetical protein
VCLNRGRASSGPRFPARPTETLGSARLDLYILPGSRGTVRINRLSCDEGQSAPRTLQTLIGIGLKN